VSQPRGRPRHPDILTPAEWRVANAVRHGMTNTEISKRLRVSRDAVKFHLENILGKLALENRTALRHWDGSPITSPLRRKGRPETSPMTIEGIGQISRHVRDVEKAVDWYKNVLCLTHLYTFGDLAFFECGGTRLFLTSRADAAHTGDSILYFLTADITGAYAQFMARGVSFRGAPHMVHRHSSGVEEWMAFFEDLDGHLLALMSQVQPLAPQEP
jgi:DNA-binding CsgD family transcriptional regulator/catechol 2,3-dioxygenase-like lactoylglutathione lyase family enzyme